MNKMILVEDQLPNTENGEFDETTRRVFVNVKLANGKIKKHMEFRRRTGQTGGAFTCFPGTWKFTGDKSTEFGLWAEAFQAMGDTSYTTSCVESPVVAWEYSKNQTPDDPDNPSTSSVLTWNEQLEKIINDTDTDPEKREAAELMQLLRMLGISSEATRRI